MHEPSVFELNSYLPSDTTAFLPVCMIVVCKFPAVLAHCAWWAYIDLQNSYHTYTVLFISACYLFNC